MSVYIIWNIESIVSVILSEAHICKDPPWYSRYDLSGLISNHDCLVGRMAAARKPKAGRYASPSSQ